MSLPAPDRILGYRILREIGRGGMATVYLAIQESLGREVALKLLSPQLTADGIAAERFLREGQIAAKLVHRHIIGIHDVGVHDGQPYMAMEYSPLGVVYFDGGMEPQKALRIIREISLALDHAHRQGVIHRDIKPENILQRADHSYALSDFGIARTLDAQIAMTQEGDTVGTPHYMSPEQLQGQAVDGRSDLYSLGVVLYQLLTGRLPYQGTDGWAIGMQHINAAMPELPKNLAVYQPLINALMAKKPEHRLQTGAAVAEAIDKLDPARTPSTATRQMPKATTKKSGTLWLAAAGVIGLAVAGWVFWPRSAPSAASQVSIPKPAMPAKIAESQRSIAVLPLLNMSGDPANEYFSDGLAETTLDMLAQVPDLKVIARTSSFAFKGKAIDVREIGKKLNVAHLLEGSVQQSGNKVRITVQLVRTSDGSHLWSQRYDRQLKDVFKIQDEIASEVVKSLQLVLPAADQQHLLEKRTDNVAAYQEYLKGIALLPKRNVSELRRALKHFERAIAIDPGYARAYASAANAITLLQNYGSLTELERKHRVQYVERALELAPALGEAHIAQSAILLNAQDFAGTTEAFERGIQLAPSYAMGFQWYGEFLLYDQGEAEKALPFFKRAVALDPLSPITNEELAYALMVIGKYEEALAINAKLRAEHPDFANAYQQYGDLRVIEGDLVGALRAFDRAIAIDPASERRKLERCGAINHFGATALARSCLKKVSDEFPLSDRQKTFDAFLYIAEGNFQTALQKIESREQPSAWEHGMALYAAGRPKDALVLYKSVVPELFKQPLGSPKLNFSGDAVVVGAAMLAAGDTDQANNLLRYGLKVFAKKPPVGHLGKNLSEVYSYTLLGEIDKACDAYSVALDHGYIEYSTLAVTPSFEKLRQAPCFAPLFARAKRTADAQIQLAQKAGLLD